MLFVSTLALIVGETTQVFAYLKSPHPGVEVVCRYIAAPFFSVVRGYLPNAGADWMTVILFGISISLMSAVFYAFVAFIITRFIWKNFIKKKGGPESPLNRFPGA